MTDTVSLPFSSQQQLLARLRHLSRLETDFILLTGPEGAGKTHLANLFLEQTSLSYPVLLDAKALDSHDRFREALLSQWFSGAIFDAQDSLVDSMTRLLAQSLHKRLLIVDNGAWLTDIQLQELIQVYATLPAALRPFMLLLGTAEWAMQVRQSLDEAMQTQVLEVEVPPLTSADQEQLWQALTFQPPPETALDIHYPGQVIDMMEPQMNIENYRHLLEQKSVKALLTVLIVVLLLIVIVSLTSSPDKPELAQSSPDELVLPAPVPNGLPPTSIGDPQSPTSALGAAPQLDANGNPVLGNDMNNNDINDNDIVQPWANAQLPETPSIAATDTQTPINGDEERIVIEDEVVNQLMQRQPNAVNAQAAPAKPTPPAPPKPVATQPAPAKPVAVSQNAGANLGSVADLKQKSPQRYTLQLLAGRNKSVLEALVSQHKLNPAWIYPRTIDGQPWFVLVQGDYVSAKQARDSVKGLPSELQAAKPWPKPFAQAQKEITP